MFAISNLERRESSKGKWRVESSPSPVVLSEESKDYRTAHQLLCKQQHHQQNSRREGRSQLYSTVNMSTSASTTTTKAKGDPFGHEGQAADYATFRPNYPDSLMKSVLDAANAKGLVQDGTLVDVCTGTGQILRKLATHFKSAKGFDRSVAQLSEATQGYNITYEAADAYSIPLPPSAASVLTIAQAVHWLDVSRFMKEADRLLVPGGMVVLLGYPICGMPDLPAAHAALDRWYKTFDNYWDCDRKFLDGEYEGKEFVPFVKVGKERVEEIHPTTVDHFDRYLRTWSAYRTWREHHPDEPDTATAVTEELKQILAKEGKDHLPVKYVSFAIFLQRPNEV